MKPTFVRCPTAEVVRTYCCLRQSAASIARGYEIQHEVRRFLKARSSHYDLPRFLTGAWSDSHCTAESSDTALEALKTRLPTEQIQVYLTADLPNRFRRHTLLLDTTLLRYLHIGFQRLLVFMDGDSQNIPEEVQLRYHLYVGSAFLAESAGKNRFAKAQYIDYFANASPNPHYTFEDVLDNIPPPPVLKYLEARLKQSEEKRER